MSGGDQNRIRQKVAAEMTSAFQARNLPRPGTDFTTSTFFPAPGAAFLVITRGPDAGARFALDKAVTRVGRHPNSDVFLDDATVSRRHAEFRVTGDNEVQVIDLGSLNGTHVNSRPTDAAPLMNGDEIELGKFHLVFLSGGPHTCGAACDTGSRLGSD